MNNSDYNQTNDIIDTVADDAYRVLHLLHRHLVNLPGLKILHHDLAILSILVQNGPLPISEIARRLSSTKPQMTQFIDRLVDEESVFRIRDPRDRRRVQVDITERGKSVLADYRSLIRNDISQKLENLDPEEVDILARDLSRIAEVIQKLQ